MFNRNSKTGIAPTARAWAEIDISALIANFEYAQKISGKPAICVLKANAYGHGAVQCAKVLQKQGALMFAVACIEEAIELREHGISIPILVLGYTPSVFTELLVKYDLEQTFVNASHARELNAVAIASGLRVKGHIKLDTGMGRSGLFAQIRFGTETIESAIDDAESLCRLPGLDIVGLYSHFSVADKPEEDDYTADQIKSYMAVYEGLRARGITIEKCHISNSAAVLKRSDVHFDYVRVGVMLYGLYPNSIPQVGDLRPVMTLKSRVSQVRPLPKGASVSYGRSFIADHDMESAVITIGYADGYPRCISNKATVTINSKKYKQIGCVCMDMCMVDVTGGDVERDDEVILFGEGGMSVEEVSQIVGTINYELTCLVTRRAHRVYINAD